MSTRSFIGIERPDGTVRAIYCQWDGYPEGNGRLLEKHWTKPEKIEKLMDLGDISSLGEVLGRKHEYSDRTHPTWTTARKRDMGRNIEAQFHFQDLQDYNAMLDSDDNWGTEWAYLFTGDGWFVREVVPVGYAWGRIEAVIERLDAA